MRRIALHGGLLLFYALLAILMTWPLATRMLVAVPGNAYDSWQNIWNLWWLKWALLHGQNPYFTPMLYYPQGAWLFLHTLNPLNFIISLPLHAAFGLIAAYNSVVILSISLAGYTMYWLAYDVCGSRLAALVGGVSFAVCGYLLAQALGGHTHMLAAWPLVLAALAVRRCCVVGPASQIQMVYASREAAKQKKYPMSRAGLRGRPILMAGLALALCILADYQYFFFAVLWALGYAGWMAYERRSWTAMLPVMVALGVAAVLVSPLLIGTIWQSRQVPTAATEGGADFRREQSVDPADLLIPSQLHSIWGGAAEQLQSYKAETHIQNKTAYLGVVTLLLAGLGLRQRRARFWLLAALLFIVLAMGPQLQLAGHVTSVPLPGSVFTLLPVLNIFRYPVRFIVLSLLCLAVLAALGASLLFARMPRSGGRIGLAAVLIGLLVLDNFTAPFPLVGIYVPSAYAKIAQDTQATAILEAPFYYRSSPVYMLYQAIHAKPLVGGYTSRRLPYDLVDEIPLMRELAFAQPAPDIIAQDSVQIAPSVLSYFRISYLNLHSTGGALRYNKLLRIAKAAGGEPLYREFAAVVVSDARTASGLQRGGGSNQDVAGTVLVYKVQPPEEALPFLGIGPGWSPVITGTQGMERHIPAGGEATLHIYCAERRVVRLSLSANTLAGSQELVFVDAQGRVLTTFDVEPEPQQYELELEVGPGMYQLQLRGSAEIAVRKVDLR